jgi:colanic acid/amylovoran biosynthesis protein
MVSAGGKACPQRILIVNAHSSLNSGDSAIALGTVEVLRHLFPSADLVATSRTPRLDRSFYKRVGVRVIPPLFHSPAGFADRHRGRAVAAASLLFPWNAVRFLFEAGRAQLLLVAGGGYFYSPERRWPGMTFWQNFLHVRIPLWFDKPVVFLPQSFGPFKDRQTSRFLLRLLTHPQTRRVFVRETISRDILKGLSDVSGKPIPVELCPDLALYHCPARSEAETALIRHMPRPQLALALRDWDFAMAEPSARRDLRERYLQTVLDACTQFFKKHRGSFVLLSQARGPARAEDDRILMRLFAQELLEAVPPAHVRCLDLPVDVHPDALIGILSSCDILITSRLHAALLSYMGGTPAITLGYLHKSRGIMRDLGMDRFCLEIHEASVDHILERIEEIVNDRNALSEEIRIRFPAVRSQIENTMRKLPMEMLPCGCANRVAESGEEGRR